MEKTLIFINKLPICNSFKDAIDSFRNIINYIFNNHNDINEEDIDFLFSNSDNLNNILNVLINTKSKKENHEFSNLCYSNNYAEILLLGYVKKNKLDINEILEDGEIKKKIILSTDETNMYIDKWQKEHDYNARNKLLEANDGLVWKIVNKYSGAFNYDDFEDMLQEGRIGLMKAIDRYDYSYGFRFSTYAWNWIKQQVLRSISEQTRIIRIPGNQVEKINRINKVAKELQNQLDRRPTLEEISEVVGIKTSDAQFLLSLNKNVISLDQKIKDDMKSRTLSDVIMLDESLENDTLKEINKIEILSTIYETLTPREVKIISLRWGLNDTRIHSLQEIANMYGLTRERIRQIEAKAIKKLKSPGVIRKLHSASNNEPIISIPTPLFNVFKDYNQKELYDAIAKLPLDYQKIIFKRYGDSLMENKQVSLNELQLLYQVIFEELEKVLKEDNLIIMAPFLSNFTDESMDSIIEAVSELGPKAKLLLVEAYGSNFEQTNPIQKNNYNKLMKIIKDIKTKVFTNNIKNNIHSIYDLFPEYDREVVLNAIESPDAISNTKVLYTVFGKNLDELLTVSPNDYMYVISVVKPVITNYIKLREKDLNKRKDSPKSIFKLTNFSKNDILTGIDKYLSDIEKEMLYKYYGYDLDDPKYMLLTDYYKSFVEKMILYKLFNGISLNKLNDVKQDNCSILKK